MGSVISAPAAIRDGAGFSPSLDELERCFADRSLLARLYCAASAIPNANTAASDWHDEPAGPQDIQVWLVGPGDSIVGAARLESSELSYFVVPGCRGSGFATWAVGAVLESFTGEPRPVHAVTERNNVGSRRLLERTGFQFAGLTPRARGHMMLYRRMTGSTRVSSHCDSLWPVPARRRRPNDGRAVQAYQGIWPPPTT